MSKTKLKPCPFCGSIDLGICNSSRSKNGDTLYFVYCCDCRGQGPTAYTDKIAAALWSYREMDE